MSRLIYGRLRFWQALPWARRGSGVPASNGELIRFRRHRRRGREKAELVASPSGSCVRSVVSGRRTAVVVGVNFQGLFFRFRGGTTPHERLLPRSFADARKTDIEFSFLHRVRDDAGFRSPKPAPTVRHRFGKDAQTSPQKDLFQAVQPG